MIDYLTIPMHFCLNAGSVDAMLQRLFFGSIFAVCGLIVGGNVGLSLASNYVHRAADGSSLPGCANDYMTGFGLIGLVAGAYVGVLLTRLPFIGNRRSPNQGKLN